MLPNKKSLIITFSLLIASTLFLLGQPNLLKAQVKDYPTRPIQLIIDKALGDVADITGRVIAEQLSQILKVSIVPLNKAGAGGVEGADYVAKAKKDGYTLLFASAAPIIHHPVIFPETVPYDSQKDLEPIARGISLPFVLVSKTDSPWKSLKELIDYAQKNPGKVRCGIAGMGTVTHFNLEIINTDTGASIIVVPFKGAAPAVTALLGGHVEATFSSIGPALPHIQAGSLRGLVISTKSSHAPEIPNSAEVGYPQIKLLNIWIGAFAPAGTPESVLKVLTPAFEKAINSPEVIKIAERLGTTIDYQKPEELRKSIKEEFEIIREVAKKAGLIKK